MIFLASLQIFDGNIWIRFSQDFNKQKAEFFRKHEINAIMMLKLTSVLVYLQTSCWVTILSVEKKHSSAQAGNSRLTPRFKCPPPPPFLRRAEAETVSQIKDDMKHNFKRGKIGWFELRDKINKNRVVVVGLIDFGGYMASFVKRLNEQNWSTGSRTGTGCAWRWFSAWQLSVP